MSSIAPVSPAQSKRQDTIRCAWPLGNPDPGTSPPGFSGTGEANSLPVFSIWAAMAHENALPAAGWLP